MNGPQWTACLTKGGSPVEDIKKMATTDAAGVIRSFVSLYKKVEI